MSVEFTFWVLFGLLVYSFVGYGLLIMALSGLRRRYTPVAPRDPLRLGMIIAAHNEERSIGARLENALAQDVGPHRLELVVVSDGSDDRTVEIAESFASRGVRAIDIKEHVGKNGALNQAVETMDCDIVIFSDANSMFGPGALLCLINHFGDPMVGGVSGELKVTKAGGNWLSRFEALYLDYDHAIKAAEARCGNVVSAQGAIYAVRRPLLRPIPAAVPDDAFNSMTVIAEGYRMTFDAGAFAEEAVGKKMSLEFGRRIRSTEQGWRNLLYFRRLLNPFRYGIYSLQLFSHKILRRLAPFLLVLLYASNWLLVTEGVFFGVFVLCQSMVYGVGVSAWLIAPLREKKWAGIPLFFVAGHVAMAAGLLRFLMGRRSERWRPVRAVGE